MLQKMRSNGIAAEDASSSGRKTFTYSNQPRTVTTVDFDDDLDDAADNNNDGSSSEASKRQKDVSPSAMTTEYELGNYSKAFSAVAAVRTSARTNSELEYDVDDDDVPRDGGYHGDKKSDGDDNHFGHTVQLNMVETVMGEEKVSASIEGTYVVEYDSDES
jgi:hypothetical protein